MQNDISKFKIVSNSKKSYFYFIIVIVLVLAVFGVRTVKKNSLYNQSQNNNKETINEAELPLGSSASENQNTKVVNNNSTENKNQALGAGEALEQKPDEQELKLADKIKLKVPFVPQAPFANWDIHEQSCEEAAILIIHYYLTGKELTKEIADKEIINMTQFQIDHYGGEKDLYKQDFVNFVKDYYGDKVKMFENASLEDIKKELNSGNPVIMPAMAKLLKNPYYHYQGYHMLDIIGYDTGRGVIITNDVGTKRGEGWEYSEKVIENTLQDQDGVFFTVGR